MDYWKRKFRPIAEQTFPGVEMVKNERRAARKAKKIMRVFKKEKVASLSFVTPKFTEEAP